MDEVYRQPVAKPNVDVVYCLSGDNKLAVGAVEVGIGEHRHNSVERFVHRVALPIEGGNMDVLVGGVKVADVVYRNGN